MPMPARLVRKASVMLRLLQDQRASAAPKHGVLLLLVFVLSAPPGVAAAFGAPTQSPLASLLREATSGSEPTGFSPSFLPDGGVVGFAVTPDGTEIYFCSFLSNVPRLFFSKYAEGQWTEPTTTSFAGDEFGGPPHISPDGARLYWRSDQPAPDDWPGVKPEPGSREAVRYWVVDRSEGEWVDPRPLELPVPAGTNLLGLSTSADSTLYTSISFQIVRFSRESGSYGIAEALSPALDGHSPAVAPDGSLLVFVHGTPRRLFVTFRTDGGSWTSPRDLGDAINGRSMNGYPSITPDGRYLFYTLGHKLHWVSIRVIEALRGRSARLR